STVGGDLVSVRAPIVTGTPNGNDFCDSNCPELRKKTTYHYLGEDGCTELSLKHNLKSITDGKGQTFLTNTYSRSSTSPASCGSSGPPYDVVISQAYGGGMLSYSYAPIAPGQTATANVVTSEATVTDRNGNLQIHHFNNQGNPLRTDIYTNRGVR